MRRRNRVLRKKTQKRHIMYLSFQVSTINYQNLAQLDGGFLVTRLASLCTPAVNANPAKPRSPLLNAVLLPLHFVSLSLSRFRPSSLSSLSSLFVFCWLNLGYVGEDWESTSWLEGSPFGPLYRETNRCYSAEAPFFLFLLQLGSRKFPLISPLGFFVSPLRVYLCVARRRQGSRTIKIYEERFLNLFYTIF